MVIGAVHVECQMRPAWHRWQAGRNVLFSATGIRACVAMQVAWTRKHITKQVLLEGEESGMSGD